MKQYVPKKEDLGPDEEMKGQGPAEEEDVEDARGQSRSGKSYAGANMPPAFSDEMEGIADLAGSKSIVEVTNANWVKVPVLHNKLQLRK